MRNYYYTVTTRRQKINKPQAPIIFFWHDEQDEISLHTSKNPELDRTKTKTNK